MVPLLSANENQEIQWQREMRNRRAVENQKGQSEQMIECWKEEKGRRMKRKADFTGGLLMADKGMWKEL